MASPEQDLFGSEEVVIYPDYIKKWKCHCVETGPAIRCVLAGPQIIRTCHYWRRKWIGCSKELTHGKVPCMCGHGKYDTRQFGYFPAYSDSGKRLVVKVPLGIAIQIKTLSRFHGIRLWREKNGKRNEMKIQYGTLVDMDMRLMYKYCERPDEHIARYLIHLWQRKDLADYYGIPFFPACSVQSRLYNEETDRLEDERIERQMAAHKKALEERNGVTGK